MQRKDEWWLYDVMNGRVTGEVGGDTISIGVAGR